MLVAGALAWLALGGCSSQHPQRVFYAGQAAAAVLERVERDAAATGRHTESRAAPPGAAHRLEARPLPHASTGVTDADWSPDGALLALVGGASLVLWDGEGAVPRRQWERAGSAASLTSVRFAPDGDHVLAATYEGEIVRWNVRTGAQQALTGSDDDRPRWLADVSPDGAWLAVWQDRRVCVVETSTGSTLPCVDSVARDGQRWRGLVAFSPDSTRLALADPGGGVTIRDVAAGAALAETGAPAQPIELLRWSPDGRLLVAGTRARLLTWNSQTGQKVSEIALPVQGEPRAIDFGSGRLLLRLAPAPAQSSKTVEEPRLALFAIDSGQVDGPQSGPTIAQVEFPGARIDTGAPLRLSPDGARFVTMERDRARVWSMESGRVMAELDRAAPEHGYQATIYRTYDGSAVHLRSEDEDTLDQVMPEAGGTVYRGWTVLPIHGRWLLDWQTRAGVMMSPALDSASWTASNMVRLGVRALSIGGQSRALTPRHSLFVTGGAGLAWDGQGPSFRGELSLLYSRVHTARPVPQLTLPRGNHYMIEVGAAVLQGSRDAVEVTAGAMWDPWLGAFARAGLQQSPEESRYYVIGVQTGWAPTLVAAVIAGVIASIAYGEPEDEETPP